jgi:microcin C transport system permease protein
MRSYFLRRFLLIPPTLIGVTFLVFCITRIVPGGPMERRMQAALAASDSSRASKDNAASLTEDMKQQIAEYYGFDQPIGPAYLIWLGVKAREVDKVRAPFVDSEGKPADTVSVTLRYLLPREQWTLTNAYGFIPATVQNLNGVARLSATDNSDLREWDARIEFPKAEENTKPAAESGEAPSAESSTGKAVLPPKAVVFRRERDGLLQGNLGISTRYNDLVWDMIRERFPISLFYGILTIILTYSICLPLGILKALKHRTVLDNVTSVLIFIGYAIPGFVLGSVLVVFTAARWGWFPTGGFVSENFGDLSAGGKIVDLFHHAVLPLTCYVIGTFAFTTMLLKNNLLDNLASDYVRTATAKGVPFRRAVIGHALRNSMIPIFSTLGQITLILVSGSIIIERIFDINGFGMLLINALIDRDMPVVMGEVTIAATLLMLGNILSDVFVALADPRIRFQ